MKKVLAVFLGLIFLAQVVKFWERDHEDASRKQSAPIKLHHPAPGKGGNDQPLIMIT